MMPVEIQEYSEASDRKYRGYWFMGVYFEALSIGVDTLTDIPIFWGEGQQLVCFIDEDHPDNQETFF